MNLFQKYLADEFAEDYSEGILSRRDALKLIASVTGSLLIADSILAGCSAPSSTETAASVTAAATEAVLEPSATSEIAPSAAPVSTEPASAAAAYGTVVPDDPAVIASEIQFPASNTNVMGYLARPSSRAISPVILVCHENRGLTPHIQDVARRFAKAGYVSLAVDLLSRQGGTAALGSDNVPGALGGIDPNQFVEDFKNGWEYLKGQSFADAARVGMIGFCFGGGVTWQVAVRMPELLAAIPFYGPPPQTDDVASIHAAVLAIYGELDSRIDSTISAIEEAMKANNKIYEKIIYPNADHAFNNDAGPRYNPQAASDAWVQSLTWFEKYVRKA